MMPRGIITSSPEMMPPVAAAVVRASPISLWFMVLPFCVCGYRRDYLGGLGNPCDLSILSVVLRFLQLCWLQVDNGSLEVCAFL